MNRPKIKSIVSRVTALAALGGGVLLLGAGILLHAQIRAATLDQLQDQLLRDATALAIYHDSGNTEALQAPPFDQAFSGHYWVIHDGRGERASNSLSGFSLGKPSANNIITGPLGEPLRAASASLESGGTLRLASDASASLALIKTLGLRLAIGLAIVWIVLTAALARLAWQGLADLRALTNDVDDLAAGRTQAVSEEQPRELVSLAKQLNSLVSAHRARIQRQRRATTQLAHALKTPLTVLRGAAETADLVGSAVPAKTVSDSVERMLPLVEDELSRARIHGPMPGLGSIPVRDQLNRAISLCAIDHGLNTADFHIDAAQADVQIEPGDLLTVLWNLLDNGCKYGGAPLRVIARDHYLSVEDSGADKPVMREAESPNEGAPGGNGTKLVDDIAAAYGWNVEVGPSPLGGRRTLLTAPELLAQDVPAPPAILESSSRTRHTPA